jgi:cellulose synthase/poly-beta-1,6-N-acetylglucosamine synthase-like glycosyltransferase
MTLFFQKLFARYPAKIRRFLEVLPGCLSWLLILSPIWGSLLIPSALTYFLLFFDIYWLYKSSALAICSYIASDKIRQAEREDWLQKASHLPNFSRVTHVLVIPNYKERIERLRATLQTIAQQTFPRERLFVVLAMEEREPEARAKARALLREFQPVFGCLMVTYHPDRAGETKGKSSNQAFAARETYRALVECGRIDLAYATVSSVDADTTFDRQYFAYLTYAFLTSPKRHHTFWQSANVSFNNFWQVPAAVRIVAFLESLWRVAVLIQPGRLLSNSTYSLSFKMLADIGFWDVDVIPEDYRIFFKAFYRLQGKVWVKPLFLKTSMDSPRASGYLQTLKSKYEQERRWAWGVSDLPLFIQWWLTVPGVPFARKTLMLYPVLLDHVLWPATWFILTLAARVMIVVNPTFSHLPTSAELLRLGGLILTPCIFTTLVLAIDLRHRPAKQGASSIKWLLFPLELVLMPATSFFLVSLPGVVSHTQLLLGKRLEYQVTEKL